MTTVAQVLEPGTLWHRVISQTEAAINCGALVSIPTDYNYLKQGNINFLVRILSNLADKERAKKQQEKQKAKSGEDFNPFLPYEKDLFVAEFSPTHLGLLNKFNVVDHHLLMVTKKFEEQESWLTVADFEALWLCLAGMDGLVFYNGGKLAGASQKHKHLQFVPFPLVPNGLKLPIEPVINRVQFHHSIGRVSEFPFVHAIAKLNPHWVEFPTEAAMVTCELYWKLLEAVGLPIKDDYYQSGAYNLLATREWMMIVPRSQETFEGIQINSLGFAGSFFVRNEEQMNQLKQQQPLTILQKVGIAW